MRCTVLKIRTCVTKYNCCGGFSWKYQQILVILNCIHRNLLSKENFPGPIMGGVGGGACTWRKEVVAEWWRAKNQPEPEISRRHDKTGGDKEGAGEGRGVGGLVCGWGGWGKLWACSLLLSRSRLGGPAFPCSPWSRPVPPCPQHGEDVHLHAALPALGQNL